MFDRRFLDDPDAELVPSGRDESPAYNFKSPFDCPSVKKGYLQRKDRESEFECREYGTPKTVDFFEDCQRCPRYKTRI